MGRLELVPSAFFFNDTATTEIYTLSLHDALPISYMETPHFLCLFYLTKRYPSFKAESQHHFLLHALLNPTTSRSEEHTSELQSRQYLVCRLLLEQNKAEVMAPNGSLADMAANDRA